ncbi:GPP34 family phosphoprotein [Streptomyces sp. SID2999]|uniref:GPP34 family phosphoprotein n=1 Tax=Streptomyces sp. SID2999 TaxID=2690258 RepID=UPI0013682041|nr:GPP34 family phosphoprotein [Streptomyces sp. SID2999]MYZ10512.1 GPP34 family phosphoprotein [Streptomyces sp. SID2999]
MTTPQDLLFVALDVPADRPVEQGDLSLALAAAELLDLLAAQEVTLRDEVIVPVSGHLTGDPMLDKAAASLIRTEPYESAEDWLWRRGDGLSAAYRDELEHTEPSGSGLRQLFRRADRSVERIDSDARRHAADRWARHEPLLAGLAAALGIEEPEQEEAEREEPAAHAEDERVDDRVAVVLAALGEALTELEAVRQRRRIEEDAFDNVWRAP